MNAVSALLSRSPDFENAERTGWVVARAPAHHENGALNGYATSAPEAEGVAAPSDDNREKVEDLLG